MIINVPNASVSIGVPVRRESPWKKLVSTEVAVNTTSTTEISVTEINIGSENYTKDKIIWVHVRDKEKKSRYFYGTDSFFLNYRATELTKPPVSVAATEIFRIPSRIEYYDCDSLSTNSRYGVYGYRIDKDGNLKIYARYSSVYSYTIDSTYTIDVYALDLPDGVKLFD